MADAALKDGQRKKYGKPRIVIYGSINAITNGGPAGATDGMITGSCNNPGCTKN